HWARSLCAVSASPLRSLVSIRRSRTARQPAHDTLRQAPKRCETAHATCVIMRIFYGWRIVAVCLIAAVVGNALGLFGASVYLHSIVETRGWPTGFVSGAVTSFHLISALLVMFVGSTIARVGPRPVVVTGALAMAIGVATVGRIDQPWQVYLAFLIMGV